MKSKNPKVVELVKSDYQPTKAEHEEEFSVDLPGATVAERMSAIGRALTRPVKVRWIDKPRRRRV